MTAANKFNSKNQLSKDALDMIFALLNYRLRENESSPIEIVVCGGSA
jgi:hypothetical protein